MIRRYGQTSMIAIAVVALVVSAGCGDVSDGARAGTGTEALETRASSVPGTVDPGDLPPGVTRDGITNATVLSEANAATVVETGYVGQLQIGASVRSQDVTWNYTLLQRERVQKRAAGFLFQVEQTRDGEQERVVVWSDGSNTLARSERGGQAQHRQIPKQRITSQLAAKQVLADYLGAGNYSVSEVTQRDERTLLTLTADRYDERTNPQLPSPENVTRFSSTVVVDSDGRVHFVNFHLVSEGRRSTLSFALRYDLVQLGPVQIDRPSWVEEQLVPRTTSKPSESSG